MKKLFFLTLLATIAGTSFGQRSELITTAIIPQPASLSWGSGSFILPSELIIIIPQKNLRE